MPPKARLVGTAAILAVYAGLAACNQSAMAANGDLKFDGSKYCTPFKSTSATDQSALTNPAGAFDDCIHRWGYTLAPARDPADVVAQAAVDACGPILSAWSQQLQAQSGTSDNAGGQQNGQAPSPAAQQLRMAESRALFYVVQARASGCSPPPAKTLVALNNPSS